MIIPNASTEEHIRKPNREKSILYDISMTIMQPVATIKCLGDEKTRCNLQIDALSFVNDAWLFIMFDEVVEEAGESLVVQVVIDNASFEDDHKTESKDNRIITYKDSSKDYKSEDELNGYTLISSRIIPRLLKQNASIPNLTFLNLRDDLAGQKETIVEYNFDPHDSHVKKVDALEERFEVEMSQIKATVEDRI
ncbi:hypothetical protein M5K25_009315 [Dendrobium thyrsiflorum]|uniref:Uncharacterized protein n=1 Tax=Dendrobium thyrsiflorum TaxID=117978 RepID=A0ABD0VC60_DENTH